jgi:ParB family chromosome partitioning protein
VRRTDESTLSPLLVEASILLASTRRNSTNVLRDAASTYKVDTDTIALKVKQEVAARVKAKKEAKPVPKTKKAA